jgi:hypothetical protein
MSKLLPWQIGSLSQKYCKDKYRGTFAEFRLQLNAFLANLDQCRKELVALLAKNFELVPSVWQAPARA